MKRIYMDYAATTYIDDRVLEAMSPYLRERFGNASGAYADGREAKIAVEQARGAAAKAINAAKNELYFTSGGTESDNWALLGALDKHTEKGKHIVVSSVEHHAVLHTAQFLERHGCEVTYLPVDEYGMVSPKAVESAVRGDTVLVSVMTANNEVGTINPIREIAAAAHAKGALFHTDAVQAVGHIPVDVKASGVDMLSASAHKFYGPKGVGFLYVKKGVGISGFMHGGAQEKQLRAGTESVAGIVGMAKALELACAGMRRDSLREAKLRDEMLSAIYSSVSGVKLNGHPSKRLCGNINISIENVMAEAALLDLDQNGVECSAGSACSAGSVEPSHVLLAMGLNRERAKTSLRFTLGRDTDGDDVQSAVKILAETVKRIRNV